MAYKYNPPVQIRAEDDTALAIDSAGYLTATTETVDAYSVRQATFYTAMGHTSGLASGDSADLLIHIPDTTTRFHGVPQVNSSGNGLVELFEGATGLLAGTTLTPYNNDRNSSNASTLVVYSEPTSLVLTSATKIGLQQIAPRNAVSFGGESQAVKWIWKNNTDYVLRYVSQAASNNVSFTIQYYEV